MRFTGPQDWQPAPIEPGRYANTIPLTGYQRRDGLGGNPLHPVRRDADFDDLLANTYAAIGRNQPSLRAERHFVQMPHWSGDRVPSLDRYALLPKPARLASTSISVLTASTDHTDTAAIGFHFRDSTLPTLRERLQGKSFRGVIGNLGYYYTAALQDRKFAWSHGSRYPAFPLSQPPAFLGFYAHRDPNTGTLYSNFLGAHPGAVGIRRDGTTVLLPRIEVEHYTIRLGGTECFVEHINDPQASTSDLVVFSPACRTEYIDGLIAQAEQSLGQATDWQTYAPTIPLTNAEDRVHVLVTNRGNGHMPVEYVTAIWEGSAPLPSFGAVLSFAPSRFRALFGAPERARVDLVGTPVHVTPHGPTPFDQYASLLGGLVPAVVDGHFLCQTTVRETLHLLNRYGNALSPLAQAGRESSNFDPHIREPAGLLIQTASRIGWVLMDGRHELSIGASVVDALQILQKLQTCGLLEQEIEQALFIDGGSAMKAYWVESSVHSTNLQLLNRVAAGSRNQAGSDLDGLNLYSTLAVRLIK